MFKGKKNKNREYFKGVLAKLVFVNERGKNVVLNFVKRFSSTVRFVFNRLVEGVECSVLWKANGPAYLEWISGTQVRPTVATSNIANRGTVGGVKGENLFVHLA